MITGSEIKAADAISSIRQGTGDISPAGITTISDGQRIKDSDAVIVHAEFIPHTEQIEHRELRGPRERPRRRAGRS